VDVSHDNRAGKHREPYVITSLSISKNACTETSGQPITSLTFLSDRRTQFSAMREPFTRTSFQPTRAAREHPQTHPPQSIIQNSDLANGGPNFFDDFFRRYCFGQSSSAPVSFWGFPDTSLFSGEDKMRTRRIMSHNRDNKYCNREKGGRLIDFFITFWSKFWGIVRA
jgi:hypothetical protein